MFVAAQNRAGDVRSKTERLLNGPEGLLCEALLPLQAWKVTSTIWRSLTREVMVWREHSHHQLSLSKLHIQNKY